MAYNYDSIRLEYTGNDSGAAAILTLNRPERMNAFTKGMAAELIDALDVVDADDRVRSLIITGAGKAFCAGMDLSTDGNVFGLDENIDPDSPDMEINRDLGGKLVLRLFRMRKPVIGAINGASVGVGSTMQLPMDRRIASLNARFGFVFSQRGITLESCAAWFLPRIVGIEQALDWSLSGRVFGAAEARDAGLVSHITSAEMLMDTALQIAESYAAKTSPVSVAVNRQMLWRMMGASHPMDAHRMDSRTMMYASMRDGKEGVQSFLDKRPADFTDSVAGAEIPGLDFDDEPPFWGGGR